MTDMSGVSAKGSSDTAPTQPTFSYAQAAKGKTAVPLSAQASKAGSVSSNTSKELATSTVAAPALAANGNSGAASNHTTSPVPNSHLEELSNGVDSKSSDANLVASPSPQRQLSPPAIPISAPSSPDFGTASTSTLQKEDDNSSTQNTSSDSTWDKQSQASVQADKMSDHANGDGDKSKEKEKDKVTPKALVEAAAPAENVWERRAKETLAAKAKLNQNSTLNQQAPPKASSSMANTNGYIPGPTFQGGKPGLEKTNDQGKFDTRRKGRFTNGTAEETEKALSAHAGDRKDIVSFGREKRKSFDGHNKYREDNPRRIGARGKGSPDKPKENTGVLAPPPVDDSTSWPTPELAQSEDKKRVQEKGEKSDKEKPVVAGAKTHGKEKWMPVPYTPTVIYNTPLPALRGRGGKSTRGSRGGAHMGSSVSNGVDRGTTVQAPTPVDANDQNVPESPARSDSTAVPLRPAKRSTSPGPSSSNPNRKLGHPSMPEKRRDSELTGSHEPDVGPSTTSPASRRMSTATQTDNAPRFRQEYRPGHRGDTGPFNGHGQAGDRNERGHSHNNDSHTHPRSAGPDRRAEGFGRSSDYYRENGNYGASRERGEGRSDRGRGGYRGPRGSGSNGFSNGHSNHAYANGHHAHQHNSSNYSYPKPQSSYPAPQQPSQQANHYGHTQQQSRGYRAGARSHSVPNPVMYTGFGQGVPAGPQQLPPLQTQMGPMYDYQSMQMMSAIAYSPLTGQFADLSRALIGQLEYYFSIENLCKDMYLRKHMDSQGFVPLDVVAKFNRIKLLTEDMESIRYACFVSQELEFLTGADNVDRLRKKYNWQQWVLAVENRDPLAQNDGPSELHQPNSPFSQQVIFDGQYMVDHPQISTSPMEMMIVGEPMVVDGTANVSLNGITPPFVPAVEALAAEGATSSGSHAAATPLSAAVPDFSPSVPSANGTALPEPEPEKEGKNAFTDEQVESLVIVVRKPGNTKPGMPFRNASSRTFSNGSIDVRTIADELDRHDERQSRSLTVRDSDVFEPENGQGPKSPLDPPTPHKLNGSNPSPVLWVKDRATPMDSLPDDVTHESYQVFRKNALKQREQSGHGKNHRDMDVLYEFWSHFLIRNFNSRMFEEFRQLAHEDATERQSNVGTKHLIQYYDESLASKNAISEEIARHYVQLVKSEDRSKERPGFEKLRAAWQNDALNMKNRKRIDNVIDPELRAELER